MATKFGRKNPRLKCSALMGSKVMQGSARVKHGSNCLQMHYVHHIWYEEPLTRMLSIVGVEGHAAVIWGQPDSNCPETAKNVKSRKCSESSVALEQAKLTKLAIAYFVIALMMPIGALVLLK